jgi:threonine dehydratase
VSGGNIDVNFISTIIERGLVKAGRRVRISTHIPDRPGALQQLLNLVAKTKANVIHIWHDRVERNVPLGQAVVEISLETRDALHTEEILTMIRSAGYEVCMI